MLGLLTMINRSHKEQEKDFKNISDKVDDMDMDGMGNFSRFPTEKPTKKNRLVKSRKKVKL